MRSAFPGRIPNFFLDPARHARHDRPHLDAPRTADIGMTRASPATLFSPLQLGAFALAHRVVMPAMARGRASAAGVPSAMMARYYGARATPGGMIICEACAVSSDRLRPHAPGLFTTEQVNHWQQVTRAVHDRGGIVLAQLDHGGWTQDDDISWPDASLETAVLAYRNAAENAGDAGFDGVELLVAHGALPERICLNDRPAHEHADRFLGTLTGTLANVWGSDRVGVCMSPGAREPDGGAGWLDDYTRTVNALHREPVAFLHVMDTASASDTTTSVRASALLRAAKPDGMLVSGGHSRDSAMASVAQGDADAIGFGRAFIANPDLVDRLRDGVALNTVDPTTLLGGDERGYLDYPLR
jgi:N-ethylmaleimide reductase